MAMAQRKAVTRDRIPARCTKCDAEMIDDGTGAHKSIRYDCQSSYVYFHTGDYEFDEAHGCVANQRDALVDALEEVSILFGTTDDANENFERLAAQFHHETGRLAP